MSWDLTERVIPQVAEGAHLVVATSGGVDSMVLLDVLHRVGAERGAALTVAHLDHGLREDSADDAAFVAEHAESLGHPVVCERVELGDAGNVESAARSARYAFLARVAAGCEAVAVATAHNATDQAETVLLRLVRGAGLHGLSGMRRERWLGPCPLIRPLLGTTREEILDYAQRRGLQWRDDSTNDDLDRSRNRIRHRVLPELAQINPRVVQTLLRSAGVAAGDARALELLDEQLLSRCEDDEGLSAVRLAELPEPWQARVARAWLWALRGTPPPVRDVERLLSLAAGAGPSQHADLSEGVGIRCETGRIEAATPVDPAPETRCQPGSTDLLGLGLRLLWPAADETRGLEIRLRADCLGPELVVGPPRAGDRIRPYGLGGSKKLQDLLVDCKVPRSRRARVPVLRRGERVLAVAAPHAQRLLAVDEAAQATPKTETTCLILASVP